MRVAAESTGGDALLIDLEDGYSGRVLDRDRRILFPPNSLGSIIARGYWRTPTGDYDLDAILSDPNLEKRELPPAEAGQYEEHRRATEEDADASGG